MYRESVAPGRLLALGAIGVDLRIPQKPIVADAREWPDRGRAVPRLGWAGDRGWCGRVFRMLGRA